MLALTLSLLTAIFLLGPDLISRYILGFVAPRRIIEQTKSEEIMRAILTALIPLALSCLWIREQHVIDWNAAKPAIQALFSGIYSDKFFEDNPSRFFQSAKTVSWITVKLAWRLYALLIPYAILLDVIIYKYGDIRNSRLMANSALARQLLAIFILPRISEWHLILKSFSHKKSADIRADVLTKSDVLYRGRIEDILLAKDGSVAAVYLFDPRRYQREKYLDDRKSGASINSEDYWKPIPSHGFLIMSSDIATINLRQYNPPADPEFMKRLQEILNEKLTAALRRRSEFHSKDAP